MALRDISQEYSLSGQEEQGGGSVGEACDPPEEKYFVVLADLC